MFENEKFIDHNIAELCMQYDKIHGVNINIARKSIVARKKIKKGDNKTIGKIIPKAIAIKPNIIPKIHNTKTITGICSRI